MIFLDLEKAFDTVDHNILLSRLKFYGVNVGTTQDWFESYLNNRSQKCSVNSSLSRAKNSHLRHPTRDNSWRTVISILYINDFPNCLVNSEPLMYADDTHLTYASNNTEYIEGIERTLNQDLANVSDWLKANKLTLNKLKTECLVIESGYILGTFNKLAQSSSGQFSNQASLL